MPYFIKSGDKFKVTSEAALDLHDKLPTGTYSVDVDGSGGLFLQIIESFEITGKLYGETTRHSDRILSTFLNRESSTGVLLAGEKGSGKTLLSKHLSIQAAKEHGIPTLVVNKPLGGEKFNTFLQTIEQPTVIIFDEFEKVFGSRGQQQMLTLLDGVYPSKKLFLLTCNEKSRINVNMKNRPGRIFYLLDFHGLSQKFIREYCEDNLQDKLYIDTVCHTALLFDAFNFDMIKAVVEEMNRYGESPSQVLKYLNVRPAFDTNKQYTYVLRIKDEGIVAEQEWSGQPLLRTIRMSYQCNKCKRQHTIDFTAQDLKTMDAGRGTFTFVNKEKKARLDLTEKLNMFSIDYDNLIPGSLSTALTRKRKKPLDGAGDEDRDDGNKTEDTQEIGDY